jgi:hypothetical protein
MTKKLDVRFGSLADLLTDFSLMAAFAWKATARITGLGHEAALQILLIDLE